MSELIHMSGFEDLGGGCSYPACLPDSTLRMTLDSAEVTCPSCLEYMAIETEDALSSYRLMVSGQPGASMPPGVLVSNPSGDLMYKVLDGGTFDSNGEMVVDVVKVERS